MRKCEKSEISLIRQFRIHTYHGLSRNANITSNVKSAVSTTKLKKRYKLQLQFNQKLKDKEFNMTISLCSVNGMIWLLYNSPEGNKFWYFSFGSRPLLRQHFIATRTTS